MTKDLFFFFFSGLAILASIAIIFQKEPLKAAFSMFVVLFSTAMIYLLLGLYFLAAVQIIIYASAIMALFVISMSSMANVKEIENKLFSLKNLFYSSLVFFLAASLFTVMFGPDIQWLDPFKIDFSTFSYTLFKNYWVTIEIASMILFTAMVAAYVFSSSKKDFKEGK